jgi:hydroxyethylthiazole kinase-like uncharacterized protein yjeF
MISGSYPILSCEEARVLESRIFMGDEEKEWRAMSHAGRAIGKTVIEDFKEIGEFPVDARVMVLSGKGHNGGDALIAATTILQQFPSATVQVHFVFGERDLRPLARRAWMELAVRGAERVTTVTCASWGKHYDICLDGIFGFQFNPPTSEEVAAIIGKVNALPVRLRAAVDLPSAGLFRADFCYATGSVKFPALVGTESGRVRYLDLGFFSDDMPGKARVVDATVLDPLRRLRPAHSDKRTYGHVFIVAGSRHYPGAAMMAVRAALRSGVGLVTAFVPDTLVPAFAARMPEAMWVGCPETAEGGLSLEGLHLLRQREDRATALVIGPGIGREAETLALVAELVQTATIPVLLDADALQPETVRAAKAPLVLTPHAGELKRISGGATLEEFATATGAAVVAKGPHTRVATGGEIYYSFAGGPVLARGGSGDLLAGLTGGLIAQRPEALGLAAVQGVVWHGMAADSLARLRGQIAVETTELLDFLGPVLRQR